MIFYIFTDNSLKSNEKNDKGYKSNNEKILKPIKTNFISLLLILISKSNYAFSKCIKTKILRHKHAHSHTHFNICYLRLRNSD
jgi:hypothetical protein